MSKYQLVQSRGRKRKQLVDASEPSLHLAHKRQRASSTPPAEDAFGELLLRKREIDNPAESNLPRAKRVRRAKAREHTLQEQAGSDHAEFHSYPTGRILRREARRSFPSCSAIDQLPSNLDFDVPPLSEATGLSQDLGSLMPVEQGSQTKQG